ncbi:WGR domain-containing protein [Thioalkalicoccus limnaeus]|uniref:WGR domain-containing protein n=1 Tax=Thioalkalicoccus limnaeus TaxID=120681 RepID=A0ABV4BHV4_9GAMM
MPRWINDEKGRYYQAELVQDLFGAWTLITWWGGLGSRRGAMRSTAVASLEAGLERLRRIDKTRLGNGYRRADDRPTSSAPS